MPDGAPSPSDRCSLASKGNLPIANSIIERPKLQTSDLTVYFWPWILSGAMYVDVPTKVSATELTNSPDTPKSQSFI